MVLKVNHEEYKELIELYYFAKKPLFISGRFGIGKSVGAKTKAIDLAKQKEKKFFNFCESTMEEKIYVLNNVKDYFCFVDQRLSEFDSTDIKGLPVGIAQEKVKEWLEWKVPFFVKLLEHPDSDGILFFDEMNLAPQLVQSSCYKIINDRIINDTKVGADWMLMGAGNTNDDRAAITEMAAPLRDRMGEVEVIGSTNDKWAVEYAIPKNINTMIIGFNYFQDNLWVVDFDSEQKFTTHRGWEQLSDLMATAGKIGKSREDFPNKDEYYQYLLRVAGSRVGEGVASKFVAFCKIQETIDLEKVIAHPEELKKIKEMDVKWFINSAIAERYGKDKIKIDKIADVTKVLDSMNNIEFVVYLLKLCFSFNKKFVDEFMKSKAFDKEFVNKYTKYMV
jgi:hypothetical protein